MTRTRKRLHIGAVIHHPSGVSTVRIGKGNYLLDTPVAEQIAHQITHLQRAFEQQYGDDQPFGLASAVFCVLTGRIPQPGELLVHRNLDSKDLRFENVTPGTHVSRCQVNLRRVPRGTFSPHTGVTRLGKGRYRARLQVPGENRWYSLGVWPTRKAAQNARIRKHAEVQAARLFGSVSPPAGGALLK